jgi:hypothetical protein
VHKKREIKALIYDPEVVIIVGRGRGIAFSREDDVMDGAFGRVL